MLQPVLMYVLFHHSYVYLLASLNIPSFTIAWNTELKWKWYSKWGSLNSLKGLISLLKKVLRVKFSDLEAEGGLSLDLEPADKEPKNQNWLFWNMK